MVRPFDIFIMTYDMPNTKVFDICLVLFEHDYGIEDTVDYTTSSWKKPRAARESRVLSFFHAPLSLSSLSISLSLSLSFSSSLPLPANKGFACCSSKECNSLASLPSLVYRTRLFFSLSLSLSLFLVTICEVEGRQQSDLAGLEENISLG